MKGAAFFLFMLVPLAACSPDQPPPFDGNFSGNAAAVLDAQANMLEERAGNMVAAAEAALANSSGGNPAANEVAAVSAQDSARE